MLLFSAAAHAYIPLISNGPDLPPAVSQCMPGHGPGMVADLYHPSFPSLSTSSVVAQSESSGPGRWNWSRYTPWKRARFGILNPLFFFFARSIFHALFLQASRPPCAEYRARMARKCFIFRVEELLLYFSTFRLCAALKSTSSGHPFLGIHTQKLRAPGVYRFQLNSPVIFMAAWSCT